MLAPFSWTERVTSKNLKSDLMAGVTGAILTLPQAVAYAMIAGMPPVTGLYTAIITATIAALLGSSWHMISGPAAAISIVVMSIVSDIAAPGSAEFISWVLLLTAMVGLIQLGLGLFRLGTLVNFISHTVVIGFSAGAALLIASSQLKYVLGISIASGSSLYQTLHDSFMQLSVLNPYSLSIALTTLVVSVLCRRISRRLPHLLLGLLAGSIVGMVFHAQDHGVIMLGALPADLPLPALPEITGERIHTLVSGAFALAILGLIEAVSIARALAARSHQLIDGNREFVAQGVSNTVGSLFGCFASSGSFTRSGANYDAGAKTPLAALFNALLIAIIMFSFPQLTAHLPLAAMAGGIMLIAWNLIDFSHIRQIFERSRTDSIVLVVTFLSTLIFNLEFSIYAGVLISLALYLRRTSRPTIMPVAPNPEWQRRNIRNVNRYKLQQCPQFRIIRIDGSMFFGCVDHIQQHLRWLASSLEGAPHILIIGKGVNFIDISAFEMLIQEKRRIQEAGGNILFSSFKGTVMDELTSSGLLDEMGREHFFIDPHDAIASVVPALDSDVCARCEVRIFQECPSVATETAARHTVH